MVTHVNMLKAARTFTQVMKSSQRDNDQTLMKIQIVAEIPCVASRPVLLGDTRQSWVVSPAAPRPFYFYYYVVD